MLLTAADMVVGPPMAVMQQEQDMVVAQQEQDMVVELPTARIVMDKALVAMDRARTIKQCSKTRLANRVAGTLAEGLENLKAMEATRTGSLPQKNKKSMLRSLHYLTTCSSKYREDVQGLKDEIRNIKQQDVSSTRNALRIAQMAEETGRGTLERLQQQGERIHNTERNLDLASNQNRLAAEKAREIRYVGMNLSISVC